ncbi:hypothetical protein QJS66_14615 [Kocuria rhizophila]|nr:hypothetical protein QJS66_14615 [Kocuria rhizophila]
MVLLTATIGRLLVLSPQVTDGRPRCSRGSASIATSFWTASPPWCSSLSNGGVVLIIAAVIGWLAVMSAAPRRHGVRHHRARGLGRGGARESARGTSRPAVSGGSTGSGCGPASFPSSHTGALVAIVLALGFVAARRRTSATCCCGHPRSGRGRCRPPSTRDPLPRRPGRPAGGLGPG